MFFGMMNRTDFAPVLWKGNERMKQYQTLLFDLDGTLTDSGEGIMRSVQYALGAVGISVPDYRTLTAFIGPPLLASFREEYGLDDGTALRAVRAYRERFESVGIHENRVYEGIEDCLGRLQAAGKTLLVATSKPEPFAVQVLEEFGLVQYFAAVYGAPMDETARSTKADIIRAALAGSGAADHARCVMIGDRKYDAEGAHAVGIDCIGVLYGYGSEQELLDAGVCAVAAAPGELCHMLLGEV